MGLFSVLHYPAIMSDKRTRTIASDVVTRVCTINLHKRIHDKSFKSKAPRAIKAVREFAAKEMRTKDVRLDVGINREIWKQGIRNVPRRIRVVLKRKRNEDTNAKEALYTVVEVVPTKKTEFKGLMTESIEA